MTASDNDARRSARKYLQRFRSATLELDSLSDERERIMTVLYSITSDPSNDGGSQCSSDNVGNGVASLVDLVTRIDDEIKRYISVRDDVRHVVRAVMRRNITLGQCLHYRYIDFRSAETTAYDMGYTTGHERKIHGMALREAAIVIEEKMSGNAR